MAQLAKRRKARVADLEEVRLVPKTHFSRPLSSSFLCKFFARNVTTHNLVGCVTLLPTLARDIRMGQDQLFRGTLLSVSTLVRKSSDIREAWSSDMRHLLFIFFRSICLKKEVLIELLNLFMVNGLHQDAIAELIPRSNSLLNRAFSDESYRIIEPLTTASFSLLNYITWFKEINSPQSHRGLSQEGLEMSLNQVVTSLSTILMSRSGPFDYLIPRLLDLFIYQGEFDDAVDCLISYKKLNPTNRNAYIYLYKFIVKYGKDRSDYQSIVNECFDKLCEYSPSDPLIIEMLEICSIEPVKSTQILMELIDYTENKDNVQAWQKLLLYIKKSQQNEDFQTICSHYQETYSNYWLIYHWNADQLISAKSDARDLVFYKNKVARLLHPHTKFTKKAKSWLKKYPVDNNWQDETVFQLNSSNNELIDSCNSSFNLHQENYYDKDQPYNNHHNQLNIPDTIDSSLAHMFS